jgi:hypothetical protein
MLLAALAVGAACTTQEVLVVHSVPLMSAPAPYPESELLDVGVVVFKSGVPEGEIPLAELEELMQDGTFVQIRRAEAMFHAVKLRETLAQSGHWGSVWVTPADSAALDLNVTAEIIQSDGHILDLHVFAKDATGREWLDKRYDMQTALGSYNTLRYPDLDPYQDVFNEIANDLAELRAELSAERVEDIRTIAELRYASELSPEAFGDYLEERGGVYEPIRLPAVGDPMLQRTRSVRQREQLLFETLDQYYEAFTLDAEESYRGWREWSREDSIRLEEAARSAKFRTGIGALAIALSIAYGRNSDNGIAERMVRDSGIYIGGDLLRSAAVRRQERRLYTQSLQELSASFDNQMKPVVVEIQGTEHRLTGTAETQYEEWQSLLRELFISETGFEPDEIDIYAEPDPVSEGETSPSESASAPRPDSETQESASDDNGSGAADA